MVLKPPNRSSQLVAIRRLAVVLCLGALTLMCALEITARIYYFGWAGLDPRRVPIMRGLEPPGLWGDRSKSRRYRYLPNLDVFANLVHLRTNSRGLRDKEYPFAKPENTFRVAVMGSSYTIPSGVEIENAYHSVLEERLTLEHAPVTYEFINFASSVMGPRQVLSELIRRVLRNEPDLIIVSATQAVIPYYLLEWQGSPASLDRIYRWPPERMMNIQLPTKMPGFRSYFLILLNSRSVALENVRKPSPPQMEAPPTGSSPNDVVRKIGAVSRATGIPIVVLRLEYDKDIWTTPVEDRFAARVLDEGMYYVNTLEAFDGMRPMDFWVHRLDRHPNSRAHAIFADVLDEFLERNDLLGR